MSRNPTCQELAAAFRIGDAYPLLVRYTCFVNDSVKRRSVSMIWIPVVAVICVLVISAARFYFHSRWVNVVAIIIILVGIIPALVRIRWR
jgi:hypothetical protein